MEFGERVKTFPALTMTEAGAIAVPMTVQDKVKVKSLVEGITQVPAFSVTVEVFFSNVPSNASPAKMWEISEIVLPSLS